MPNAGKDAAVKLKGMTEVPRGKPFIIIIIIVVLCLFVASCNLYSPGAAGREEEDHAAELGRGIRLFLLCLD